MRQPMTMTATLHGPSLTNSALPMQHLHGCT
jgi:hypothetical protein